MTENKKNTLFKEISLYLPYDQKLSQKQKEKLLLLDGDFDEATQNVYDYFYSHVLDDGSIVSLENFLAKHPQNSDYYKKVNDAFVKDLFSHQAPLFFLDVDNTLTDLGYLSQEKIEFISNFENKDRIILTTGKAYDSIKNVIDDCGLHDNYASCLNGSVIAKSGKTDLIAGIGKVGKQIVDALYDAPFDCVVYYQDGIRLVKPLSQKSLEMLKKYNESYLEEETIDYSKVVKVLFFIYEGETEKENQVKRVVSQYPNLACMRTAGHTYEVLHESQHKGTTVKLISNLLNRYYRTSIGVGDSMNDWQLLNYTGKSFVVATANADLKQAGYPQLDQNRDTDIVKLIKIYS